MTHQKDQPSSCWAANINRLNLKKLIYVEGSGDNAPSDYARWAHIGDLLLNPELAEDGVCSRLYALWEIANLFCDVVSNTTLDEVKDESPSALARSDFAMASFDRRLHGGLPSLPGLRSTGSCRWRSCRPICLRAGLVRWSLSSRWRYSPRPSLLSLGPVRTSRPTCQALLSSRVDRTASRATPLTSACSWV